jgi:hypothetical protein
MAKYRKLPVVVEATQFHRVDHFDGKRVTLDGVETRMTSGGRVFFIRMSGGDQLVEEGDFVITGTRGERYPCKPDIFAATYEPVLRPGEIGDEDG